MPRGMRWRPCPIPEAGDALRDAVAKTSGPVKAGLIDSLGWRRDTAAIPLLAAALSDPDATVAAAAAMALGRIGGTDSEAALFKAFATSTGPVKDAVLDAILNCAEIRMNIDNTSDAGGLLSEDSPGPAILRDPPGRVEGVGVVGRQSTAGTCCRSAGRQR